MRSDELDQRAIYECHGTGSHHEVAAFLIGYGKYHYYGIGSWWGVGNNGNFSEHWMPGVFDRTLGQPKRALYDIASHTWTRNFTDGTLVTFNVSTSKGKVAWSSDETVNQLKHRLKDDEEQPQVVAHNGQEQEHRSEPVHFVNASTPSTYAEMDR